MQAGRRVAAPIVRNVGDPIPTGGRIFVGTEPSDKRQRVRNWIAMLIAELKRQCRYRFAWTRDTPSCPTAVFIAEAASLSVSRPSLFASAIENTAFAEPVSAPSNSDVLR